jgi:hypothetical protein
MNRGGDQWAPMACGMRRRLLDRYPDVLIRKCATLQTLPKACCEWLHTSDGDLSFPIRHRSLRHDCQNSDYRRTIALDGEMLALAAPPDRFPVFEHRGRGWCRCAAEAEEHEDTDAASDVRRCTSSSSTSPQIHEAPSECLRAHSGVAPRAVRARRPSGSAS